MSYPSICIAGIDIELIQNLKKGICISNSQQTIEVRPLLKENSKWNIEEHETINLYSVFEFEGEYLSQDFSKEDFYINSFKISDEIYELKNLSDDYYQIAKNHFECCDGFLLINQLIITGLPKKFSPFCKTSCI